MESEKHYGRVHAFDPFKGYGFIRREKGSDVFFTYEDILGEEITCSEGDLVKFEIIKLPKGYRAKNIVRVT